MPLGKIFVENQMLLIFRDITLKRLIFQTQKFTQSVKNKDEIMTLLTPMSFLIDKGFGRLLRMV